MAKFLKISLYRRRAQIVGPFIYALFLVAFGAHSSLAEFVQTSDSATIIQDKIKVSHDFYKDGKYQDAERVLRECLVVYEATGRKDWTLITILNNLELTLMKLGKSKESIEYRNRKRSLEDSLGGVEPLYQKSPTPSPHHDKSLQPPASPSRAPSSSPGGQRPRRDGNSMRQSAYEQRAQYRDQELSRRAETELRGTQAAVRLVIALTPNDRDLILHPTTAEKTVLDHYETHYAYRANGTQYSYREPIYRQDTYNVTKVEDIPFYIELRSLADRCSLSRREFDRCKQAILEGGAVLELDNSWVILVPESADYDNWRLAKVLVSEHSHLRFPGVLVSNLQARQSFDGEILYGR